jgi:cystathionine beta-lyase/cystathionine gamma-synthase
MRKLRLSSQAVHGGMHTVVDNQPEAMPIYQTSVFTFDHVSHMEDYFAGGDHNLYLYSRNKNPNPTAFEETVALFEGGESAVATSSGMAAIMAALLTVAKAGDHILCASEIYGVTGVLIEKELARLGLEYTFCSFSDMDQVKEAIQSNTTVLITEVVTNPLLTVISIPDLAKLAHHYNCKLIVDNTFTSPYIIQPLLVGADIVINSATKYLNGHNDVTAGVVVADSQTIQRTREIVVTMGCSLGAFEAWLAHRGLKTFALRMKQHCHNGAAIAEFLAAHPKVEKVYYPGLSTHDTYEWAKLLLNGRYGGMISFKVADDSRVIDRFIEALQLIKLAPSLAGVGTTLSHPMKTSHRAWGKDKQEEWGITMGLLRMSIGIEDTEDIISDLAQALEVL